MTILKELSSILERKIDDLQTELGHLTWMVRAIMQHLGVKVGRDYLGW